MIVVRDLKVVSFSQDFLDLSWTIEDTIENVLDFDFFIQRSEGEEGPFDTVGGPLVDEFNFRFRDARAPKYWRGRQHIYRIEIINRLTKETEDSSTAQSLPAADLVTQEIRRLEFVRFKEFAARKIFAFPRRTFGQRCGSCWDPIKKRKRRANCAECFDTGFARGYLRPIQTFMQIEPNFGQAGQSERLTDLGKTQHNLITARAPVVPFYKAGDMVIEAEGTRWKVVGVVSYQHLRSPVAQQLTMIQIPENDMEFRIPIEGIDPIVFEPTASRAFTNPQNIDAIREGRSRSVT